LTNVDQSAISKRIKRYGLREKKWIGVFNVLNAQTLLISQIRRVNGFYALLVLVRLSSGRGH
jgi:hypothetical protein